MVNRSKFPYALSTISLNVRACLPVGGAMKPILNKLSSVGTLIIFNLIISSGSVSALANEIGENTNYYSGLQKTVSSKPVTGGFTALTFTEDAVYNALPYGNLKTIAAGGTLSSDKPYVAAIEVLDGNVQFITKLELETIGYARESTDEFATYGLRVLKGSFTSSSNSFIAAAHDISKKATGLGVYVGAADGDIATFSHTAVPDCFDDEPGDMHIYGDTFAALATRNGIINLDFSKGNNGIIQNGMAALDGGVINFTTGQGKTEGDILASDYGSINLNIPAGTFQGSTENYSQTLGRNLSFEKVNKYLGLNLNFDTKGHITTLIGNNGSWVVTKDSWLDVITLNGGTVDLATYSIPVQSAKASSDYRRLTTGTLTSNLSEDSGTIKLRIDLKNESKDNRALDQLIITDKNVNQSSSGSYAVTIDFTGADLRNPKLFSDNFLIRYGTDGADDTANAITFISGDLNPRNGKEKVYFSPNGATYSYRLAYFNDPTNQLTSKEERENAGTTGTHGYWHLVLVGDVPQPEPEPEPEPKPEPQPEPKPEPQPKPEPEPEPEPEPQPQPQPSPNPEQPPITPPITPEVDLIQNIGTSYGQYLAWRSDLTDLRHRLGEIRFSNNTGAWIKGLYDRERGHAIQGNGFKQETFGAHFGADARIDNTDWILGGSLRFAHSDQDSLSAIGNGQGKLDAYSAKIYASYLNERGLYADFVANAGLFDQEISGRSNQNNILVKADYKTYGYGLSAETGYSIEINHKNSLHGTSHWFIEPQIQLAYFQIKGRDWKTSTGMSVSQDNVESVIGRIGFVSGKTYNYGNDINNKKHFQVASRVGLIHEFLGKQKIELNRIYKFETDLGGTTFYYGLTSDWQFDNRQRIYLNIDREEGSNYSKDISARLGYRLLF